MAGQRARWEVGRDRVQEAAWRGAVFTEGGAPPLRACSYGTRG